MKRPVTNAGKEALLAVRRSSLMFRLLKKALQLPLALGQEDMAGERKESSFENLNFISSDCLAQSILHPLLTFDICIIDKLPYLVK